VNVQNIAKKVFEIESKAINNLSNLLTENFEKAITTIYHSNGKLIISGMGKSGIIGRKIAATLSSTGTPSFFLHPGEAYHGDLGMIEKEDILLLISNSGETDEVLKLIPFLKSQGNVIISMSGKLKSTLAINSDYYINISINKEACPLNLAPTTSTTATLVMGDAIAISLMKLRGFKDKNFTKFHPGGNLGRKLLTTIESVMKKDNLPILNSESYIKDIINKITSGKLGLVVVIDDNIIQGVITDGDIRRTMESDENIFFSLNAKKIMNKTPKKIQSHKKLIEANKIMNNEKINSLLVVNNDDKLVGIVQMYDLGI